MKVSKQGEYEGIVWIRFLYSSLYMGEAIIRVWENPFRLFLVPAKKGIRQADGECRFYLPIFLRGDLRNRCVWDF